MKKQDYLQSFKKAVKSLDIKNILINFQEEEYFYIDNSSNFISFTKENFWENWMDYPSLNISYSNENKGCGGYVDSHDRFCNLWICDYPNNDNFIKTAIQHEIRHFWQWLQGERFNNENVAYRERSVEKDAYLYTEYVSYKKATLLEIARDKGIKGVSKLNKKDLINKLLGFVPNKD